MYACSVVHVMRICCFKLCCLEFSFGYLKNSLPRISLSQIFKKGHEFFAFHGKFARTKDDFQRILFALLLHDTVGKTRSASHPDLWEHGGHLGLLSVLSQENGLRAAWTRVTESIASSSIKMSSAVDLDEKI